MKRNQVVLKFLMPTCKWMLHLFVSGTGKFNFECCQGGAEMSHASMHVDAVVGYFGMGKANFT